MVKTTLLRRIKMYNKVILVGNLSRDVELRYTPNGTAVAKFGLATNRTYIDPATKEKKQEVMFIDITIFGRAAESANQYLKKGSQVLVEGRLVLNSWTGQDGQKRSKHEIIAESLKFLGKNENTHQATNYQNQGNYRQNTPQQSNNNEANQLDLDEEDIPF